LNRAPRFCKVAIVRGRKTVRADHQLRADEKTIRAQSTILYESNPKSSLLLSITVFFGTDVPLIRTKNTVGARSAQVAKWRAT
jgi:hypothetical protein